MLRKGFDNIRVYAMPVEEMDKSAIKYIFLQNYRFCLIVTYNIKYV